MTSELSHDTTDSGQSCEVSGTTPQDIADGLASLGLDCSVPLDRMKTDRPGNFENDAVHIKISRMSDTGPAEYHIWLGTSITAGRTSYEFVEEQYVEWDSIVTTVATMIEPYKNHRPMRAAPRNLTPIRELMAASRAATSVPTLQPTAAPVIETTKTPVTEPTTQFTLVSCSYAGNEESATATVSIAVNTPGAKPDVIERMGEGEGVVEAIYKAINQIVAEARVNLRDIELILFKINGVSNGLDSDGEVHVNITDGRKRSSGSAAHRSILRASALAYVNAINSLLAMQRKG